MSTDAGPGTSPRPRTARNVIFRILHDLRRVDRAIWAVLLLALVAVFVWRQRADVAHTIVVLRTADGRWVLALLVSALAMHGIFTLTLSSLLAAIGHRIPLRPALTTYAERQTVATVVPAGGVPSVMILMRRFAPFGVTSNDALFAVVLFSVLGHVSFLAIMLPVLGWLLTQHAASAATLLATGLLVLVALATAVLVARLLRGAPLPRWLERRLPESARSFLASIREHHLTGRALLGPFALSLLGDIAGVWCVYVGLRAVDVTPSLPVAAAGYTIGTLFLLVAPLFQGLGLVELTMTVALERLGVPAPQALGATLLYRTGEVWLPVVFGIALQARHQKRLLGLPAYLPALWTGFNGIVAILSVMPHQIRRTMPHHGHVAATPLLTPHNASRSVILVAGFLLILCAYGLLRRQRTAWTAATILAAAVAFAQLGKDIDRLGTLIAVVNLALLLLYARRFRVRSDPPTMRRGLALLAISFVVAFGYVAGSLWLANRREFGEDFSMRSAMIQTVDIYFSLDSGGLAPRTPNAEWLVDSFHLVGAISVLVAVVSLIRPVVWRHRTEPAEREHARQLIAAYGDSSQDIFKTWPDKHQFFSSTGDGVISFGLANGVALCLGDPAGRTPAAVRRVLVEFLDVCDANGWTPALHQAGPRWLDLYREEGLTPLKIGAEAIVDVDTFTLSGRHMKNLRNVMNRFQREGYRATLHEPPLSPSLVRKLRAVSDAWLTLPGRRERGFTLGQFSEAYIAACPVLTVETSEGEIAAFINLIPSGVPGEVTFDLMRHRPDAPNGAMDFLMVTLIEQAKARGEHRVSLGMVPFVDVGTEPDAALQERTLALLSEPLGRFFDAESLRRYKDKFNPTWEPRYLVYRNIARLPAIGLAIARLTEGRPQVAGAVPPPVPATRRPSLAT